MTTLDGRHAYDGVERECALAMYHIGMSTHQIASELDICQGTILRWVNQNGGARNTAEARRLRSNDRAYGWVREQRPLNQIAPSRNAAARAIGASPNSAARWWDE